jgi:hypothetical protein
MNDHDGGMAAAEQDDGEGVLSRGAGAAWPIGIPGSSWHAHDGLAAATAGIRRRFCLEAESTALAGNGGHSSNHRSKAELSNGFEELHLQREGSDSDE